MLTVDRPHLYAHCGRCRVQAPARQRLLGVPSPKRCQSVLRRAPQHGAIVTTAVTANTLKSARVGAHGRSPLPPAPARLTCTSRKD